MAEWQIILGTGSRVQSFPCAFPSSTDVPVRLLNQPNRSWQRRSFAKSNDRGKVGLHFVPKCNHAHKSHTSQYNIWLYFGLLRSRNFPTMAKQQKWLLSIARFVYITVLHWSQTSEPKVVAYIIVHVHWIFFLKNPLLFLEKGIKIANDCIQNDFVMVHDKSYLLMFCM